MYLIVLWYLDNYYNNIFVFRIIFMLLYINNFLKILYLCQCLNISENNDRTLMSVFKYIMYVPINWLKT